MTLTEGCLVKPGQTSDTALQHNTDVQQQTAIVRINHRTFIPTGSLWEITCSKQAPKGWSPTQRTCTTFAESVLEQLLQAAVKKEKGQRRSLLLYYNVKTHSSLLYVLVIAVFSFVPLAIYCTYISAIDKIDIRSVECVGQLTECRECALVNCGLMDIESVSVAQGVRRSWRITWESRAKGMQADRRMARSCQVPGVPSPAWPSLPSATTSICQP